MNENAAPSNEAIAPTPVAAPNPISNTPPPESPNPNVKVAGSPDVVVSSGAHPVNKAVLVICILIIIIVLGIFGTFLYFYFFKGSNQAGVVKNEVSVISEVVPASANYPSPSPLGVDQQLANVTSGLDSLNIQLGAVDKSLSEKQPSLE